MPSIQWNRQRWGKEHRWPAHGDEWSYLFGSAAVHWQAFLLPRIHRFLPKFETGAARIVEIGPGHGRWTQFLLPHCDSFVGYDVTEECIAYCRQRFGAQVAGGYAEFHVNDGLNLTENDNSVDFVFSFDSLVHVERDVMQSYLGHLGKCLRPGAVAFLQHSNLGAYPHLQNYRNAGPYNARGVTVSAATMQADAREHGLVTLIQEGLNHETQFVNNELVDCISLIQKPASAKTALEPVFLDNKRYAEIGQISNASIWHYEHYNLER
jgi:2-polyprenyl-3-methyl-5-hydroxy-6-metoxy-1,4-benzoquinol methylase